VGSGWTPPTLKRNLIRGTVDERSAAGQAVKGVDGASQLVAHEPGNEEILHGGEGSASHTRPSPLQQRC